MRSEDNHEWLIDKDLERGRGLIQATNPAFDCRDRVEPVTWSDSNEVLPE
jgi:hypothetical protein